MLQHTETLPLRQPCDRDTRHDEARRGARHARCLPERMRLVRSTLVALVALLAGCDRSAVTPTPTPTPAAETPSAPHQEIRALLTAPGAVRWTTVATVLGDGVESCVDGRAEQPVLGTPGGDVGEIVLALAALEQTTGELITSAALDALFDAYEESFGRVYFHTDQRAMESLRGAMLTDPRFATVRGHLSSVAALRRFLLSPPLEHRAALLEYLVRPDHVGCGHVRLALLHPASYGVRAELVRDVIASTFRLAWRDSHAVDYEVLEGEHRESAVVEVKLGHAVHAHSRVPMLTPHVPGLEVFVHHPDVAAFVRRENGTFFLEHATTLVRRQPAESEYLARLDALGDAQLRETMHRLAPSLPTIVVSAEHLPGGDMMRAAPPVPIK